MQRTWVKFPPGLHWLIRAGCWCHQNKETGWSCVDVVYIPLSDYHLSRLSVDHLASTIKPCVELVPSVCAPSTGDVWVAQIQGTPFPLEMLKTLSPCLSLR